MTQETGTAEALVGHEVPRAAEEDLVETLAGYGLALRTRRVLAHRGPSELQWAVLIALPLHGFLTGLGTEAVKDAYAGLKGLVRRVLRSGAAAAEGEPALESRPLVLQDAASGLRVVLEADLPSEAYEQLVGLDLTRFRQGPLHYDRARGRWRSELDEAAGPAV
ncbi:hypothetical protein GCM10009801_41780 [Streptomyces albiaxialis]|uniref:Uncharacterized protein n=1 Tax=Streptomyces albiaxialis TaxID=329523 RepID=A0ABN2W2Q2_9ACTN